MKKIPTLFQRDPEDMSRLLSDVNPACEWVLAGEGVATRKYDGQGVLIRRDGLVHRAMTRFGVKPGKEPPPGFVEIDHDPVTGKRYGWQPAGQSSWVKYINEALDDAPPEGLMPGTYELCGPRVNRNREGFERHVLVPHAKARRVDIPPPAPGVPALLHYLKAVVPLGYQGWEGVVWHHPDGRMAKLKARDFQ